MRRESIVPHPVMHGLEVPHALTRLDVESHQALGEQIVTQSVTTVVVAGRGTGSVSSTANVAHALVSP